MIRRSLWGSLALLSVATACGEESGASPAARDIDSGSSNGEGDAGEVDSGQTEAAACSSSSECEAPAEPCLIAECRSGKCEVHAQVDGLACDDGDACTRTDQCVAGQCTGSNPVECLGENACHEVGACDPASGLCSSSDKPDGTACSLTALCKAGECLEPVVVLARQDFEETPAAPTWAFTGEPVYQAGTSSATASPPTSPLGVGGSRAWETTTNSGGSTIEFDNVEIPEGFDSARLRFRLAAMNLIGEGGGPDNLDYVVVSLSLDGGQNFYGRVRIRGGVNDNSYWGYDATGVASVPHAPQAEALFQPTESGLQTTLGYSTVEVTFDSSVRQVKVSLTARSSSSTDTWLIDDVVLTAERDLTAL